MEGLVPANKMKRFAVDHVDLVVIPILLGAIIGLVLLAASDAIRSAVLIIVNIAWLLFRDAVFSVGRKGVLRKPINIFMLVISLVVFIVAAIPNPAVLSTLIFLVPYWGVLVVLIMNDKGGDLKIISMTGLKVTWLQAGIRNVFLVVPFALVTGYFCEMIRLIFNKTLLWRRILYGIVLAIALVFVPGAVAAGAFAVMGILLALVAPVVFLICDRETEASGRLADLWAKTQVVEA